MDKKATNQDLLILQQLQEAQQAKIDERDRASRLLAKVAVYSSVSLAIVATCLTVLLLALVGK